MKPHSLVPALAVALCLALPASALANQTLTVEKQGSGIAGSSVTSSPSGIECGPTCQASFSNGALITLTATPGPNTQAATWTGCDAVLAGKCEVTMSSAKAVKATFALVQHQLSVTKAGTGTGTVKSSPGPIDCGAICSASYEHGVTVTLTGSPGPNTDSVAWTGCGEVNPEGRCIVSMSQARAVTATFTLGKRELKLAKAGTGTGTVTSSPAGIACGGSCSFVFNAGTVVTLSATPGPETEAAKWSGCDSVNGEDKCLVELASAREVTASFNSTGPELTVTKAGTGTGTVQSSPAGILCGAACSIRFLAGTTVTLTATPAPGSVFERWAGGGCAGAGACTTTLKAAKALKAIFDLFGTRTLTVSKAGSGQGTVTSKPAGTGIDCGQTCAFAILAATKVTLTAKAAKGSSFNRWSGACQGTAKTCKVTMSEAKSVTAAFSAPPGAAAPAPAPASKPRKCKRGFKKRRVHGKTKCVRVKHRRHQGKSGRRG